MNRHDTAIMEIHGYELGRIVAMTSGGPLWSTVGRDGAEALVSLHSSGEGEALEARWRAWAGVSHPGIARLLDVVRHEDGRWALVQERVAGRPLDLLLGSPALRPRAVRERILADVSDAVLALHRAGLVHTDVAPANILVDEDGRAVLIDLVRPVGPGEGTEGWSLSEAKDETSDWEAVARLAEALGLEGACGMSPVETSPEVDRGTESGSARSDETPGADLRRAAARAETLRVPRKRTPRGGLVAAACALVLLAAGAGVALRGVGAAPARAEVAAPGATCPSAKEAAEGLRDLLAARDAAITSRDARALEGRVGGALGKQDRARIAALVEAGQSVAGLATSAEVLGEPSCTGEIVGVRARLVQSAASICAAGSCRELPAPSPVALELTFPLGRWIALEARAIDG